MKLIRRARAWWSAKHPAQFVNRRVSGVKAWWSDWRWRRLYSRRHSVAALISAGVLVAALLYANGLMTTHAPPQDLATAEPVIEITPTFGKPPTGLGSFDISARMLVRGCHNPVQVVLSLEAQGSQAVAAARFTPVAADLDGQILDPTDSASGFQEYALPRGSWRAMFRDSGRARYSRLRTVYTEPYPPPRNSFVIDRDWDPLHGKTFLAPVDALFAKTSSLDGSVVFGQSALYVTFRANWVSPRVTSRSVV